MIHTHVLQVTESAQYIINSIKYCILIHMKAVTVKYISAILIVIVIPVSVFLVQNITGVVKDRQIGESIEDNSIIADEKHIDIENNVLSVEDAHRIAIESEDDKTKLEAQSDDPKNEVVPVSSIYSVFTSSPLKTDESVEVELPQEAEYIAIRYKADSVEFAFDSYEFARVIPGAEGSHELENLVSGMIEVSDADKINLRNLSKHTQPISLDIFLKQESEDLVTMEYEQTSFEPQKYSGALYTELPIIPRSVWGANPASWNGDSRSINDLSRLSWDPYYYRNDKVIIHHTVTNFNYAAPYNSVRSIYNYHAISRGWGDIGYNYLIDPQGRIYEGKLGGDEVYGYHSAREANMIGLSIALIGNFTYTTPTNEALNSLATLIAERASFNGYGIRLANGSASHWTNNAYTIYGHRDSYYWDGSRWVVNSTACPGNAFHAVLDDIVIPKVVDRVNEFQHLRDNRADVDQWLDSLPAETNSYWVVFDRPSSVSSSEILNLIPPNSGISSIKIHENRAKITVHDWHTTTDLWDATDVFASSCFNYYYTQPESGCVPDEGYGGESSYVTGSGVAMISPRFDGPRDRLSTLISIFNMSPDVQSVYPDTLGSDYRKITQESPVETSEPRYRQFSSQ